MSKFIEWWKKHYARNMGLTIVLTVIVAFFVLALFGSKAEAADYIIGLDTTKPITCTNATTRTDGTSLAESAIDFVTITVRGPTPAPYAFNLDIQKPGGCATATTFDLTQLPGPGAYEQVGTTTDMQGRTGPLSPTPFTFGYVTSNAPPNPPTMIQ